MTEQTTNDNNIGDAVRPYTYDAFISYRHTDLDKYAAELLHKKLEAFRLPGNLARQRRDGRTRINRVFRDKDELPLTSNLEDPIMKALAASDYLIVICSPRLRESLWCRKEIETFISMHGREKVLAVLIEGEPSDSFPDELLYREETVTEADGSTRTRKVPMEPLAADIRGQDRKAMKKALKTELLRLLAPVFALNYDDLRQRHRERRMKRILTASLSVGAVCLAFGAVSTTMALRIRSQNTQIQAQAEEILAQNEAIQRQNQEITEQNRALLTNQAVTLAEEAFRLLDAGDREGAIGTAYTALTSYQGSELPYTPQAQYALTESLHVYDNGMSIKPMHQMETAGVIYYMKLSENREMLVTYDNSQCLTVWDIAAGTKLGEIRDIENFHEDKFLVMGNERVVYSNDESQLSVYDIASGQIVREPDFDYVSSVYGDVQGRHLVIHNWDGLCVLDGQTYEQLDQFDSHYIYHVQVSSDGRFLAFQEESDEENSLLYLWNLDTGEKYPALDVGDASMQMVKCREDTAYVLLNKSDGDFFSMETSVLAWNYETGQVRWEYTTEDFGSSIWLPSAEGATRMLLLAGFEGHLLELSDGAEAESIPYGTEIAGAAVYMDIDYFMVFTRSGEYHMLNASSLEDYYITSSFLSHSQNVRKFLALSEGYVLLPYKDNHVTYYSTSRGEELTPYDGEVQVPETENYLYGAAEEAEKLGLLKAALTQRLFYDSDGGRLFVSYSDSTVEIYSRSDMSLINTLTDVKEIPAQFLGTDSQGNLYIAGSSYGYMLDAQCSPLAVIEGLAGVDAQNNRVILSRSGQMYTVPIYTVEELLAKAREVVL